MLGLPGPLGTLIDLLAVMLGFGFIVFIHELGHFVAARWAGIRVLTFAVGFGPPIVSWRRGIGVRRGSSAAEAARRLAAGPGSDGASRIGQTEYRLSALPFGGYVQMLGQDDLDPGSVSEAPDSYQNAPVWKRMVVISAGVAMNVVLAGVLFVAVFMAGLQVEPPIVGGVREGSPASVAAPLAEGVEPGLRPGDLIVEIAGHEPQRFDSIIMEVATSRAGRPIPLAVARDGSSEPVRFEVTPEKGETTGLLEIGVLPAFSTALVEPRGAADIATLERELDAAGVGRLDPGDRVVSANGEPVEYARRLTEIFESSGGAPVRVAVERADGSSFEAEFEPRREMQVGLASLPTLEGEPFEHLLGLTPVMTVSDLGQPEQGLEHGDVFVRIGSVEFPSTVEGIAEIRAHAGEPLELVVARGGLSDGTPELVTIRAEVTRDGRVGFYPGSTKARTALLSVPPARYRDAETGETVRGHAAGLFERAGAQILSVNGRPVGDFGSLHRALLDATADARASGESGATLTLAYRYPFAAAELERVYETDWTLDAPALAGLAALGWENPIPVYRFAPVETTLRASGPIDAVRLGLIETRRVMTSVYVTFLRLTQGSLNVEHIKGPVGIAHLGTVVADRGLVWMLFFLGMISVNLAVVNFLPLPIVDGGQFLMLLYEQIRGKPVPIPVQNAVMMAGLLLIGSVFLLVTFNDIKSLLG